MARDPALIDRRLRLAAGAWLLRASVIYRLRIAPIVGEQLVRWERRAREIEDPELRALALYKLHREGLNARAATMAAAGVRRAKRPRVIEAIVALEVLFDYLDGRTELPSEHPLREGSELFKAFTAAITRTPWQPAGTERGDDHYLSELSAAVSSAISDLPGIEAVAEQLHRAVARAAEAQVRAHGAPRVGSAQLERWARAESRAQGLPWRELLLGAAASVIAVHALIAAAAEPGGTPPEAQRLSDAYLQVSALATMLDAIVDHQHDDETESPYLTLFEDREAIAQTLSRIAHRAFNGTGALADPGRHVMILSGVLAYYLTDPGAESPFARGFTEPLRVELRRAIAPALCVMKVLRRAERARAGSPDTVGLGHGEGHGTRAAEVAGA